MMSLAQFLKCVRHVVVLAAGVSLLWAAPAAASGGECHDEGDCRVCDFGDCEAWICSDGGAFIECDG